MKVWTDKNFEAAKRRGETGTFADGRNGLHIRVAASGIAFFWRGRVAGMGRDVKKITIGQWPAMSIPEARERAAQMAAFAAAGEFLKMDDLRAGARAKAKALPAVAALDVGSPTVAQAISKYLEYIKLKNKPNTIKDKEYFYNNRIIRPYGDRKLRQVDSYLLEDIVEGIREEGKLTAANNAIAYISSFYKWATRDGYRYTKIDINPTGRLVKTKPVRRTRTLSIDEIRVLMSVLRDKPERWKFGYMLLLLLGQRKREIFGLHRSEIDFENRWIALSESRTKNGRAHVVPFGALAALYLKRLVDTAPADGYVFGNAGKPEGFSRIHANIIYEMFRHDVRPDWVLHDLRRTFASQAYEMKAAGSLDVDTISIEAMLNHVSGQRDGVAGIYNRYDYIDAKRAITAVWEKRLLDVMGANILL